MVLHIRTPPSGCSHPQIPLKSRIENRSEKYTAPIGFLTVGRGRHFVTLRR